MKTRTIVFETKFNVGDEVFCITNGQICRGTVIDVFAEMEKCSLYSVLDKPKIQVSYEVKIKSGEFATSAHLSESSLASSLEEFCIYGD